MLTLENVSVFYGPVLAVSELNLEVGGSGALALLGPNGAGKTSTLRAISRLIPCQGVIRFDGSDTSGLTADELARRGLIHVPEGRHVFGPLTVHENIQAGLAARAGRQPLYGLDDVYDLFPPLARLRGQAGWSLSGGEQQMVAIARALVAAPRLLLLDEPTLGLAPAIVTELFAALTHVKAQIPVMLVEQNTAVALKFCTYAQILVLGRTVLSGSASELGNRQGLLSEYLGQKDIGRSSDGSVLKPTTSDASVADSPSGETLVLPLSLTPTPKIDYEPASQGTGRGASTLPRKGVLAKWIGRARGDVDSGAEKGD